MNRKSGLIHLRINNDGYSTKGSFKYGLGIGKKESLLSSDGSVVGYKFQPEAPFIEGEIYDSKGLDLAAITRTDDATITLELANGKIIALRNAWVISTEGQTEDGNITIRFEGLSAEEIK